jgi:RNA polymerase sigma-70 factor (ECF subfamily)
MKYKEVAAEMKLTIPAVKSRILRGRQKLHKSILSCCTINQNGAGEVIDFELKSKDFCGSC